MSNHIIKIAIADDHQVFREGLSFILSKNESFKILFDVADGKELLEKLRFYQPDVVLLDIRMPNIDGVQATKEIRADFPRTKIIILTMNDNDDFILMLLDMGVNGYLLKNTSSAEVIHTIESVIEKGFHFDDRVMQIMLRGLSKRRFPKPKPKDIKVDLLTPKEQVIMKLILKEYSNLQIAEKLDLSTRTVETHRKNILEKLNVKNTVGLVIRALELGFLPDDNNDDDDNDE
jgi:DNA-binding NarL/FixJ family response regulator